MNSDVELLSHESTYRLESDANLYDDNSIKEQVILFENNIEAGLKYAIDNQLQKIKFVVLYKRNINADVIKQIIRAEQFQLFQYVCNKNPSLVKKHEKYIFKTKGQFLFYYIQLFRPELKIWDYDSTYYPKYYQRLFQLTLKYYRQESKIFASLIIFSLYMMILFNSSLQFNYFFDAYLIILGTYWMLSNQWLIFKTHYSTNPLESRYFLPDESDFMDIFEENCIDIDDWIELSDLIEQNNLCEIDRCCFACASYVDKTTYHCKICMKCSPLHIQHSYLFDRCINEYNGLFCVMNALTQLLMVILYYLRAYIYQDRIDQNYLTIFIYILLVFIFIFNFQLCYEVYHKAQSLDPMESFVINCFKYASFLIRTAQII